MTRGAVNAAAAAGSRTRPRPGWSFAAKAAVSLAILAALGWRIDWTGIAERAALASPGWLAVGLFLKFAGVLLCGERWRWAAAAAGTRLSPGTAQRLMFAGLFFGQVLPGAVGGDIVRGWLTFRVGCPAATVIVAVILDRVLALLGVVILLFAGLPWLVGAAADLAWAAPVAVLGLSAAMAIGLQADRVPLPAVLRRPAVAALLGYAGALRRALLRRAAVASAGHALGVHLTTIAAVIAFAHAFGAAVPVGAALAVVPVVILAAALPISLNGWGVREGAMVAGLALFGVGPAEATLVSLAVGLSVVLISLPGGLLWLSLKRAETGAAQRPQNGNGATRGM